MDIGEIIARASAIGASDVHLVFGLPPKCRLQGDIMDIADFTLSDELCEEYAAALAGDLYDRVRTTGELDFARSFGDIRVRINLFRQRGHISAAIRILSDRIPELGSLGLPPAVMSFPSLRSGIVLITGETGSGKSTTLAALLDAINHTRRCHIVTLEDPIEYVYTPDLCIISQREIGKDTESYASGLRAVLREDPDIILIGEMRDLDTIETALTAAETGHLVFATLHTNTAADSVDRIVDVFPEGKQHQIRMQLSMSLYAVLSQHLIKRADNKGRVAACEIMIVNPAIRNLIREGKTPQIANTLATSAQDGSITMDNALIKLFKDKAIRAETAREAARDAEYVKRNTMH